MSKSLFGYVLDSSALLAFFQGEEGGITVKSFLERAQQKQVHLFLSVIQYGEILYATERIHGKEQKQKIQELLDMLPLTVCSADLSSAITAAEIKAKGGIAYPDGFVIALALQKNASILTKDKEFQKFSDRVMIEWL